MLLKTSKSVHVIDICHKNIVYTHSKVKLKFSLMSLGGIMGYWKQRIPSLTINTVSTTNAITIVSMLAQILTHLKKHSRNI